MLVTSLSNRHRQGCEGPGPGRSSHAAHVGGGGRLGGQETHVSPALRGSGRRRATRPPRVINDTQLQSQLPLTCRHFSTLLGVFTLRKGEDRKPWGAGAEVFCTPPARRPQHYVVVPEVLWPVGVRLWHPPLTSGGSGQREPQDSGCEHETLPSGAIEGAEAPGAAARSGVTRHAGRKRDLTVGDLT